jgi:cell division protein FtsB
LARQRQKKSNTSSGHLVTPGRVGILLLLLAALWVGSGFVSKMVVAHRLNAEVAQLQKDNRQLQLTNRGYQSELTALAQAGGKEEQQRLHNYIQRDEKVYLVAQPSPGPSPSPSPRAASAATSVAAQPGGFWNDFWGALTSSLH